MSKKSELYIPENAVEVAKELQLDLSLADSIEAKRDLANAALEVIGDPREYKNSKKVIVSADYACVVNDDLSSDAELYYGLELHDIFIKSYFRFGYIERNKKFGSICLLLYDADVISEKTKMYNGENITSGVYVPVFDVRMMLPT